MKKNQFDDCFVLASFLNHKKDPQRNDFWKSDDIISIYPLISSVVSKNLKIKIFHNCFDTYPAIENCEWIKVDTDSRFVPNVNRWFIQKNWIKKNYKSIDSVFMVDSTDVEMLKNPFKSLKENKIYCGNEFHNKLENEWMKKTQEPLLKIVDYRNLIEKYQDRELLNCGIVGGRKDIILKFLNNLCLLHERFSSDISGSTDMSVFNYNIYKYFLKKYVSGESINTRFKFYEYNDTSWWKHK